MIQTELYGVCKLKWGQIMISKIDKLFKEIGYTGDTVVVNYEVGDNIKITDGPFKGMLGTIDNIDVENNTLTVLIDLFGPETPVEVELCQVVVE